MMQHEIENRDTRDCYGRLTRAASVRYAIVRSPSCNRHFLLVNPQGAVVEEFRNLLDAQRTASARIDDERAL
jgi:hypothetical protein